MPPRVRLGRETFVVVDRSKLIERPWSVESARARLDGLDRSGLVAAGREHLAARGGLPALATDADVLELLARSLVDGSLRLVDVTDPPRAVDTEAVVDLADLAEPQVPVAPPPRPGATEPRESFIEVLLADSQGAPVEADYVLSIDGAPQAGHFGPGHRVEPVSDAAVATLQLRRVAVPHEASPATPVSPEPGLPGVEPPAPPLPDAPSPAGPTQVYVDTRLQLEDEHGQPIESARCIVDVDGAFTEIPYASEAVALPEGTAAKLRIEALRLSAPRA